MSGYTDSAGLHGSIRFVNTLSHFSQSFAHLINKHNDLLFNPYRKAGRKFKISTSSFSHGPGVLDIPCVDYENVTSTSDVHVAYNHHRTSEYSKHFPIILLIFYTCHVFQCRVILIFKVSIATKE